MDKRKEERRERGGVWGGVGGKETRKRRVALRFGERRGEGMEERKTKGECAAIWDWCVFQ